MEMFIIQEVIQGVVQLPKLFLNEKDAEEKYIRLVNEIHDNNFKTIQEAKEYVEDINDDNNNVYYWDMEKYNLG